MFFVLFFTSENIDNPYLNVTMDSHKSQVQGSFESIIERAEIIEIFYVLEFVILLDMFSNK